MRNGFDGTADVVAEAREQVGIGAQARKGNTVLLTNIQPESNTKKFWAVQVIGKCAVCSWGRIGSWEQNKAFNFRSPEAAVQFAISKVFSKLDGGYVIQSGRR